ncbi:MAG: GtrA family protein [Christensenellaceae bacterium]
MKYDNITVILTESKQQLHIDLKNAGFSSIIIRPKNEPLRLYFEHALTTDSSLFVNVDEADGFCIDDIKNVCAALAQDEKKVYVGARVHEKKINLPQKIYGFLSGISAADITSSLIALSRATLILMTQMKSSNKNFRQNILLEARQNSIEIKEIPTNLLQTQTLSWGILTSSVKLYLIFIKFSISATIAYIVDIGSFYLLSKLLFGLTDEFKILTATVLSRILCSIATYFLNKGAVFKSQARSTGTVVRFVILSAGQLVASWLLVWGLGSLLGGSDAVNTLLKVVVDFVIFMASFTLQRDWVFKKTNKLLK